MDNSKKQFEEMAAGLGSFAEMFKNNLDASLGSLTTELQSNPEAARELKKQIQEINLHGSAYDLQKGLKSLNKTFKK